MRVEICKCDFCGAEYREDHGELKFRFGTYQDPAEGIKPETHTVDLCVSCLQRELQQLIKVLPEDYQETCYKQIRSQSKNRKSIVLPG